MSTLETAPTRSWRQRYWRKALPGLGFYGILLLVALAAAAQEQCSPAIPALVAAAAGVTALLYGKTTRTHLLSVAAADGVLRVDWLDGDRACSAQARTPAGAAPGRPASSSGSGPSLDDSRAAMLLSFQRGAGKILQLQLGRQSIEQYTSPDWPTERLERLAAALSAGHR